jgi:hypothetical protein
MNPTLKSRDYHRAYQKWERLLIDGKADEIVIVPGTHSDVTFSLIVKKKPKGNSEKVLQVLKKLPRGLLSLKEIREDYDGTIRV